MLKTSLVFLLIVIFLLIRFKYLFFDRYYWNNAKCIDQSKLIKTFNKFGCVIIPNILSNEDCDDLMDVISKEENSHNKETGNIHSNFKRLDLMLPFKDTKKYIKKICFDLQYFCDMLVPNSTIVENSSLISYPGCYPQIWHTDTEYNDNDANLISFGVALDHISKDMGPLEIFLKSNKIYKHTNQLYDKYHIEDNQEIDDNDDDGLKHQPILELCKKFKFKREQCSCKKGSLVIWSSKVVHRGGENNKKRRPVFSFSLMGNGNSPIGSNYSLKKNDKKYTIKDLLETNIDKRAGN